jgi:ATP-dependent DNA helicase RecG
MKTNVTDKVSDRVTDKVTDRVTDRVTDNQQTIILAIKENNKVTTSDLAEIVGISQRKIKENMAKLKEYGIIERIGPPKGGHWEIIK